MTTPCSAKQASYPIWQDDPVDFWPEPRVQCPPAWQGDSIAVELADKECARLIANCMFDPPITEEEIEKYARRLKTTKRQAELQIREGREAHHGRNQKAAA